ncbi:MAG: helix-turn-helix domain-containing protein [Candidatus Aenigmarchaeota archaeon]|nr:helix-turn-helix domain-containing protein [Candidatus Aenigmarchaeota archaeon]
MKGYLTVNDLSKMIGRSPGAIRNLVLRRRIPYRKPGGRLLFLAEEIDRWIDQAEGVRVEDLEDGIT